MPSYFLIEITDALIGRAVALVENYKLRGYDAVQLAAAVELQAVRLAMGLPPILFVSADQILNAAASLEGFVVDNPNFHP